MGCCGKMVGVSSKRLAEELGASQQTASRKIRELEREGYITREMLPRGQKIRLTSKGVEVLRKLQLDLEKILEGLEYVAYVISGEITSGIGEGGYYMRLPGYAKQFKEKLGFEPYPGTLNLRLRSREDMEARQVLQRLEGIEIKGFTQNNRTFGPVKCFKATIDGIEGAVVIPARTHHGVNALEVIAPEKIRDALKLKEGDVVSVKVEI